MFYSKKKIREQINKGCIEECPEFALNAIAMMLYNKFEGEGLDD